MTNKVTVQKVQLERNLLQEVIEKKLQLFGYFVQ